MTVGAATISRWDEHLLRAAISLGGELTLAGLAARLAPAVAVLPGARFAALGAFDGERHIFRGIILPAETDSDGLAFELPESAVRVTGGDSVPGPNRPAGQAVADLRQTIQHELHERAAARGCTTCLTEGIWLGDRLIGALVVGLVEEDLPAAPSGERAAGTAFVHQLAGVVAPVLWNCVTQERFERGDRRRDALIGLYKSINTSLRFDGVLAAAHAALAEVAGAAASSIELIEPDGRTYRAYGSAPALAENSARAAEAAVAPSRPPLREIAGTVLAQIQLQGKTYLSDDLAVRAAFDGDRERHVRGVRRYVATPLRARGRLLGALVVGSADPHPVLQIDVWLYENIALQIALAFDNARQHEEVQRLSDQLREQNVYLREEIQREHDLTEMVGNAPAMRRVLDDIARVAPTEAIVLITGETGVGKELVARAIHAASPRAAQPMVKVNCAAIPEALVESELFGHERGAFTSAVERRIGRFELSIDGTLFLDEVGELPLPVQSKLLRVLQDGEFERVGGAKTLRTNARILAATNRNLLAEVEAGRFRRDLYYRLNVFPLQIPPLRERPEDIPLLANTFAAQFARRMGKRIESIDAACLEELSLRDWPGNVRELRHVIERATILCEETVLRIEPEPASAPAPPRASRPAESPPWVSRPAEGPPWASRPVEPPPPVSRPVEPPPQVSVPAAVGQRAADATTLAGSLSAFEAEVIRRALQQTNGIIEGPRGAARLLDLTPSTLRYRMRRLGIRRA